MNETVNPDDLFERLELQKQEDLKRKELERKLNNALINVMSTEDGRRVMAWLLELTGIDESVTSTDAMGMAIASAQRDIGLVVARKVQGLCRQSYLLMQEEQLNG